MIRMQLILTFLIFLTSLAQITVFSGWGFWGVSPQIWLVVVYFLYATYGWHAPPPYLLVYFVFYDLLTFSRPAFVGSLIFILGLLVFKTLIERFLGRKTMVSPVFFLWLNFLGLVFIKPLGQFSPGLLLASTLINLALYILVYPLLQLFKAWYCQNERPQLSLKI